MLFIPYHHFSHTQGTDAILDKIQEEKRKKKIKYRRAKLTWLISCLLNGFIRKLNVS